MTITDWIQAISMIVLVAVTAFYAWRTANIANATKRQSEATKQQADASMKMAEEMKKHRYDTVRPIIDIQGLVKSNLATGEEMISEGMYARDNDISKGVLCILKNIGLGPAIDVKSFIPFENGSKDWDFGTLGIRDVTEKRYLSLKQEGSQIYLVVLYRDAYGRDFESKRQVRSTKEMGWELSPLKINLMGREQDNS